MTRDPALEAHKQWVGYVQPVGVVASPPALLAAQAYVDRNIINEHSFLLERIEDMQLKGTATKAMIELSSFLCDVLGWQKDDIVGLDGKPVPDSLEAPLPEYEEVLRPSFAVREVEPEDGGAEWLMLGQVVDAGADLDAAPPEAGRGWHASAMSRFERLLRETKVPIGLLTNATHLRLVYAPPGETSGHVTFEVSQMAEIAGRPIFAAFIMLLGADRLFTLPRTQRLPAILEQSRKFQNEVSTKLADQVLAALYELLRGVQAADAQTNSRLLSEVLREDPDHVYAGLLTVLLRLVFLLFAEDRDLISTEPTYVKHYSVAGLFDKLRADSGRHPDTMDQRYGAWAQLLALFRMVHDGASHSGLRIPARQGNLFDPNRFNFLEGRPWTIGRVPGDRIEPPLVSDGVVFRVLSNLLVLDGERLSYRNLDVEQIGSVYETMMGFTLEVATGPSIAIKPAKRHGAPVTIDLDELLAVEPGRRAQWVGKNSDQRVPDSAKQLLQSATTPDEVVTALVSKIDRRATPNIVPTGAMVLQPSEERRRSGSHYTPRSLTEPIVREALRPVLDALAPNPTPEVILGLKLLDPAMGSAAFLVETCRQLSEVLRDSWHWHDRVPHIPPDEDELLHAGRLIAQRCLYGIDKNPIAAELAKLSLWLATLARDHAFTFLDHAFRSGDSLVGLTRKQIESFHWAPTGHVEFAASRIEDRVKEAAQLRAEIRAAGEDADPNTLRSTLHTADGALDDVRLIGDLAVGAFFQASSARERERIRAERAEQVRGWLEGDGGRIELLTMVEKMRSGTRSITPFHWEIEFPEVFEGENPGFDVIVGNPPFLSGTAVSTAFGMDYFRWITSLFPPAGHLCDLVAYFYRRAFQLLRSRGCFGMVATNTIAQGDTREGGLLPILREGGTIYRADRRFRWPGTAAVIVSVVHVRKGSEPHSALDGKSVERISAYLVPGTVDESPMRLNQNPMFSLGSKIYGQGFLFDDEDPKATPISHIDGLLSRCPQCADRILPYIGGEEVNLSPTHSPRRFVIYLSDVRTQEELAPWPELAEIVRERVKPERDALGSNPNNVPLKRRWWAYQAHRPELYRTIRDFDRVLVCARVQPHWAITFMPTDVVFSEALVVFAMQTDAGFATLQSRVHEMWARFLASSLKDDLRYTPSDCFETFPLPEDFDSHPALQVTGRDYYEYRAELMVANDEGLTKTYNRFNDPEETSKDIERLRELHATMDKAVLATYGWDDLNPVCDFILDYEDEDDEGGSRRRKPWRYRWINEVRDEVLARLLALNSERAEQERLEGRIAEAGNARPRGRQKPWASRTAPPLFEEP
jgi:hypothetical protein